MGKRRRIGIIYYYNENWIGGTYYIQNLIASMNTLPDDENVDIEVLSYDLDACRKLLDITAYPFLKADTFRKKLSLPQRAVNKCSRILTGRNVYSDLHNDLDFVFPLDNLSNFPEGQKGCFWIPDFQEHFLPEFFSEKEIEGRKINQQNIIHSGHSIVFSSEAARRDFNQIYPNNKSEQYVLHFAVTHNLGEKNELPPKGDLLDKYHLPDCYFLCSNQFWIHKNHKRILEAIARLKDRQIDVHVAFSGKETDYRFPDFYKKLQALVVELGISENVSFLGFIDRIDQLGLIKYARAVIQPSLFEGWSTVIEDAMSLNAFILASDIPANVEQLSLYPNHLFFSPHESGELAAAMNTVWTQVPGIVPFDYRKKVQEFGRQFKEIINRELA